MKFYMIVLLAGLWSTAVTAAPQSTPNFSLQEYVLDHSVFSDFGKMIAKYWETVQCVQNVIAEAVANSEFKNLFEQTKAELEKLFVVDWQKCADHSQIAEQTKCRAVVVQKGVDALVAFVKQLAAANKWDCLKQINEQVVAKCFQSQGGLFDFDDEVEQFRDEFLAKFECLADVLDDVSKAHNLEHLWSKSQPQLLHHLGKWKQCDKAGNAVLVGICKLKEAAAGFAIASEYVKLAAAQDSTFVQDFRNQFMENCADNSYANELSEMSVTDDVNACIKKLVEKCHCISEAISEAVKGTNYQKIWEQYSQGWNKVQHQLELCKNQSTTTEAAKCIKNELKNGYKFFSQFLLDVKQANSDLYNKIKMNIKRNCYA